MGVCPPGIFYHIRIEAHRTLANILYVHCSVPLELRGWSRLYLRITIFDADERRGVVTQGSSVTKEDLSTAGVEKLTLETVEWNHEEVASSSLISRSGKKFPLITAPPVLVKSTVEGTVGGGEGRRRGGG